MCGLAGLLDLEGVEGREDLRHLAFRMADTLETRGPDDRGAWADETVGIALGFRRLAIVDVSPEGHQPMQSACGRLILAFNGEIYNHAEVRRELETDLGGEAPRYRGHSDTEVMLAAFARWGVEASVQRFVGMFAFALWDRRERTLYLGRDRIGEKPLYYGWMGRTLLFGSELKALRAHPAFRAEIDRDALVPYLRRGYIPAPLSIYRGIRKLLPGTLLAIRADEAPKDLEPKPYWSARSIAEAGCADPFTGTETEAVDELERLLKQAVGQQMVAEVPLGAFLSGGIDSSTIVALMQSQSSRPVRTFTIGFQESAYNEAEHAKAVAHHLGTDHTELYVTAEETLAVLPRLPTLFDEPFADSSQIPTFLVAQMARRSVTVSLSGDGGDELFGGYERHFRRESPWYQAPRFSVGVRQSTARALRGVSTRNWDRALNLIRPVLPLRLRRHAVGDRVHRAAEIINHAEHPAAVFDRLSSLWDNPASIVLGATEPLTLLADPSAWAEVGDLAHRLMYVDLVTYLPDDILVKVDRASMGVSLESRAPMLDHRVVEFAWRLPKELKVRDGKGKRPLRLVLDRHVPRELIERPKMGFGVPVDEWLRGPLRGWAEALLDESRLRREGLFDPAPIRKRWQEHASGLRDWTDSLWTILMFQAWLEQVEA